MLDYTRVRQDFVLFMTTVLTHEAYQYYYQDFVKLLVLIRKAKANKTYETWMPPHGDRLAEFCDYLIAKMSYDKRSFISESQPEWLFALAGQFDTHYACKPEIRLWVFEEVADDAIDLLNGHGPDSRETLPCIGATEQTPCELQ